MWPPLAKPAERVFLLRTETAAIVAPGGDGREYLLWLRGGTLLAQELDRGALKLRGEGHAIDGPIFGSGLVGIMPVSASASGQLVYNTRSSASQLIWFERAGRLLAQWAKRMPTAFHSAFRLTGVARLQHVTDRAATISECLTWRAALPAGSPRHLLLTCTRYGRLMDERSCLPQPR